MFSESILGSTLFGLGLTIIIYSLAELLLTKLQIKLIPPFVLACPIIIGIIMAVPQITYEHYAKGAEFINFLLGPATIALALPLYRNRKAIMENGLAIFSGIIVATVTAIVVIYFSGKALGASEQVLLSLLPKSVTTPIAIEISKTIGGIPAITTACVIFTGMLGATMNHGLLKLCGLNNDLACGLAIGASSHGLGTSVCTARPVQLATGGVAIALTGIATSIICPLLLPILKSIG